MKTSYQSRDTQAHEEFRVHKKIQTVSVSVIGQMSYANMVKNKEIERFLVINLEQEVRNMLKEMNCKDRQLYDQNELIVLLVQKLFFVYRTLRRVDDETTPVKVDEERALLAEKIGNLEADNEMLKEAIIKAKKNLDKLEDKAEKYLEERDDIKRKHRESLELIETLQKENMRSKESLFTLEEEKKTSVNELQAKMVKELEDYEKKHRNSIDKLECLREELQKTKEENQVSICQVKNLSDENRSQADAITCLKENLRKCSEKPPTTSIGIGCRTCCKDAGVDPCCTETKSIAVENVPQIKTIGTDTLNEIETQIIPAHVFQQYQSPPIKLRTIACETEFSKSPKSETVDTYVGPSKPNICTVRRAPILKKREAVEILEILDTETMDAFSCGPCTSNEPLEYVQTKFTATADENCIRELLQLEIIDVASQGCTRTKQPLGELDVFRPNKEVQCTAESCYNAEVIFNCDSMCQSSNDSLLTDDPENNILNQGFIEKSSKSVRINPKRLETERVFKDRSTGSEGSESDISATYYTIKSDSNTYEYPFKKKEIADLELLKKVAKRRGLGFNKPRSLKAPQTKKKQTQASHAAEDLQNVVQDLNESVSRIIEKSPNEKATRQKIIQLEEQLRAALKQKEHDVEVERQKRNQEVENLKLTISEMEKALKNKQTNSTNLQSAVDLYTNTVSVLEKSEERYKTQVAQQSITIANLQEALVATKQQLDELKQKLEKDLEEKYILLEILDISLRDLEKQCYHYRNQCSNETATIDFLRDEILKLEVDKFELTQDVLLLESRLLKYQQVSKQYECICGLKREVQKLHVEIDLFKAEVENLQNYIRRCHHEINSTKTILGKYLGQECSEYCIKQDESVVTLAQDTISYTEDLQCQLAVLETALKREQKINTVQANRIEELQNIIGAKNIELSRVNDGYQDIKSKLDTANTRNRMLEQAIQELQEQLNEMELDNIYQEEKADICHGELDMCLNNLQSLKFKLRNQYKTMCQKIQDHTQLQADYRIQVNNAEVFKKDLENTRIRCRDEIIELKHNIRDLKEKLQISEDKIESLNKEVKQSQALLVEATQYESQIKQDFILREKQLSEKIHSAQDEEMRLLDVVTQLEQQIVDMKNDLDTRDVQLETAKSTIFQLNADAIIKQQVTQEEMNKLKNEINSLLQKQGMQKADNERLEQQVECLKCCVHQNESVNKSVKQQLDKCLNDLKNIEADKFFLEQRNLKLMETLDKMQVALQTRTESIATMEIELLEAKTSRDEICNESRNVVTNVRAWLEEQKNINEQLKDKLQKKNALIAKYEQEKRKSYCDCKCRATCPRQRGGALQCNYFQNNPPPGSRSPWSLDSRGSGSESPTSSVSSTPADWYEYEEVGYDVITEEPNTEVWIHKVESMTEELQRSNRYWKKKINDSEFMVTKDK